jgi:hypothetical protein
VPASAPTRRESTPAEAARWSTAGASGGREEVGKPTKAEAARWGEHQHCSTWQPAEHGRLPGKEDPPHAHHGGPCLDLAVGEEADSEPRARGGRGNTG